jgi:two-component system, sensor histidine kinase ChiS
MVGKEKMRSRSRWLLRGCLAALILPLLPLASCAAPKARTPQSEAGVLDLRSYRFDEGETAPLSGQWQYLPGSTDITFEDFLRAPTVLRKVPDLWNGSEGGLSRGHGCGSYRLTVLLPPDAPPLAFHYLSCSTAFRIEVDGRMIVQVGVPSADPKAAVAAYRPGVARIGEVGDRIEIMVRVSNYAYRSGGMWYPIFLGSAAEAQTVHHREFAVTLALATGLFVMGMILLLLFSLRRKDKAILFGGLFALVMTLRVLVTGEYILTDLWSGIPFALLVKLEYFTVFLSFPSGTAFFTSLFPDLLSKRLKRACIVPSLAFALLTCLLPVDPLTRSLFVYYAFAVFNIVILVGALLVKAIKRSSKDDAVIFAGTLILAASAINDALYSALVWWTGNLAPWGFGIFVCCQVYVLVKRLTTDISEAEELLSRKDLLIKEIHHRVKNNLQVVASLLTLQSNRVSDPATKEVFSALRLRIVSMSLVHEKLYGKAATESLDLGNYVRDLVKLVVAKDKFEAGKVSLRISTQSVDIGVDECVDIGLIVTEVVSNAVKYALLPKGGGELKVEMSVAGGRISILVEDDGPGFPPLFKAEELNTMGYKLVTSLVKKHDGSLEILGGAGGRVRIEVSASDDKAR